MGSRAAKAWHPRTGPLPLRSAYTLLEVLLALAIFVFLLGGLYVALEMQLRVADAGRGVVERSTLARGLLDRIGVEVALSLGPVAPQTTSSSSSPSSASSTPATGAGGSSTANTTATNTSGTNSTTGSAADGSTGQVVFNLGLQGDNGQLTIYVSRWPREAILPPSDPNYLSPPLVSDLRRITWFMSDAGLARQELLVATSDDALNAPAPVLGDGVSRLVATEVKSMTIQYLDPSSQSWVDTWDGTQPGDDGVTPMGPPAAVKIELVIAMPNPDGGDLPSKDYVQVIPLHAANGMSATATGANTFNPNSSTGGTQP